MALKKIARAVRKPGRFIKGVLYPGIPAKLTNPVDAQTWGRKVETRWHGALRDLNARYAGLGLELPPATRYYANKKIELGRELAYAAGRDWKKKVKETFGGIRELRAWEKSPVAVLPYRILKIENAAEGIVKKAEELSKQYEPDYALEFNERSLDRLKDYERHLDDYVKRLRGAQVRVEKLHSTFPAASTTVVERHISEARKNLERARRVLLQKREYLTGTGRRTKTGARGTGVVAWH